MYDGPSVQLWFNGASEALNIEKSSVQPQAFSQLLEALEDEFPELYGEEFSEEPDPNDLPEFEEDCPY